MLLSHAKRNARRWLALSAVAMVGIGTSSVHADLLFWDPSQTGTTSGGGDGSWDQISLNWYDPSLQSDVSWYNSGQFAGSPDDAYFGGTTAGAVSLTSTIIANSLTFNTSGYVIGSNSPGSVLKIVSGSVSIGTGLQATLNASLSGNGGLTLQSVDPAMGGGTLTLTGNNTYTGGTSITAGTILANSPVGFSSTGNGLITVTSGGLLAGTGYVLGAASQISVKAGTGAPGGLISAGTGATPDTSVGLLTTNGGDGGATAYSQVWNGGSGGTGGAYDWKVNAASPTNSTVTQSNGVGTTDSGGAGTNWDMLSMASLSVVASSGSQFNVQIVPIGTTSSAFNSSQPHAWTIADVTSGIVNVNGTAYNGNAPSTLASLQAALQAAVALNSSAMPSSNGAYSIRAASDGLSGDDILISYAPAPEPTSLSLLGLGAAAVVIRRRRKPL